jgi:hypothetical protein
LWAASKQAGRASISCFLNNDVQLQLNTRLHKHTVFCAAGDTTKATDPYFPFEDAVDVWGRTFAALGITYQGSVMTLDLCDRQGKYSNGFCHWPQVGLVQKFGFLCKCCCKQRCQSIEYRCKQQRLLPLATGAQGMAMCDCGAAFMALVLQVAVVV